MIVKLENVRLSFPDLFEPVQFNGAGDFNYKASFILTPGHKGLKDLDAAMAHVAREKWGAKADKMLERIKGDVKNCCLIDGDEKEYDGYAGNMILSASRKKKDGRPMLVDRQRQVLTTDEGILYGGCYVNTKVEIWAQDNNFGKAIRCSLIGVQFFKTGDAFGGAKRGKAEDFDELEPINEEGFGDLEDMF